MSSTNELNNNQGPTPADHDTRGGSNRHPHYTRDPQYYYQDGSAVFLVDNVLFKFQASLVFGSRPASQTPGDQRRSTGVEPLSWEPRLSSDNNPIPVPDITTGQFRDFLLVVLGLPSDPEYLGLLTDAQNKTNHSRDLLVRYLDISHIARRFEMFKLEKWAQSQLSLILESMYDIDHGRWDKETLLRLNSYAQSTRDSHLISSVTTFIQYFVSISANSQAASQRPIPLNLDTCVQLYKDPNLPKDNPAVFGCVFASILSLGHRSAIWTSELTYREKAVLYAAQVELIPVSDQLENVGWLQSKTYTLPPLDQVCSHCQSQLQRLWSESFGKCGDLNSNVVLQDVTSLARLPQYRHFLVTQWDTLGQCSPLRSEHGRESTSSSSPRDGFSGSGFWGTLALLLVGRSCQKLKHPLGDIDRRTQRVYQELAGRYKDFSPSI